MFAALTVGALVSILTPQAQAQGRLEFFGPINSQGENPSAISADGAVVAGTATGWVTPLQHAFRWTAASGAQPLGVLFSGPGNYSRAVDISANGLVVVGESGEHSAVSHAFRWTAATGMVDIASSTATPTIANGVSADGSVVVGGSGFRAFRWTQATGQQSLGTLGGNSSEAFGVSDDGEIIVGTAKDANGEKRPFRWTASTGMVAIGGTPSSSLTGAAAVSGDGSVIVGTFDGTPFRWTAASGMQFLALPGGSIAAAANGLNEDGSVVFVNNLTPAGIGETYRWTAATGLILLDTFPQQGCLPFAVDASADGSVIVGRNGCQSSNQGWLYHTSQVGERYCSPVANSTGRGALLNIRGSALVSANDITLQAEFLPPSAFGFYVASRNQGNVPQPGGSQGVLCLGGAIARFIGPGQVLDSGATGTFSLDIDLNSVPAPTGVTAIQVGETWNFQAWHRDNNPGATSNFTDAVSVMFL